MCESSGFVVGSHLAVFVWRKWHRSKIDVRTSGTQILSPADVSIKKHVDNWILNSTATTPIPVWICWRFREKWLKETLTRQNYVLCDFQFPGNSRFNSDFVKLQSCQERTHNIWPIPIRSLLTEYQLTCFRKFLFPRQCCTVSSFVCCLCKFGLAQTLFLLGSLLMILAVDIIVVEVVAGDDQSWHPGL